MGCTGAVSREKIIIKTNLKSENIEKIKEYTITSSNIESDYTVVKELKELVNIKYYLVSNKISGKNFNLKVIKRNKAKEDPNYVLKLFQLKKNFSSKHFKYC